MNFEIEQWIFSKDHIEIDSSYGEFSLPFRIKRFSFTTWLIEANKLQPNVTKSDYFDKTPSLTIEEDLKEYLLTYHSEAIQSFEAKLKKEALDA